MQDRTMQQIDLPDGTVDLGFVVGVEPRVIVILRREDTTSALAFSLPHLTPIAQRDFPGPWHALAFSGSRFLLAGTEGETAQVATVTTKLIVPHPLPLRMVPRFATRAPEGRMLIEQRGQLEFWDVENRRALFRLNLPLPPEPQQAGFTAHGRLLWVASADSTGRLDVFRFSDGRAQAQLALGGRILTADSQLDATRVAVAVQAGEDAPAKIVVLDLTLRERTLVPRDRPFDAMSIVEGSSPCILVLDDSGLDTLALRQTTTIQSAAKPPILVESATLPPPAEAPREPAAPSPERSVPTTAAGTPLELVGETTSAKIADRIGAWRSRLRGGLPGKPATSEAASVEAAEPPPPPSAQPSTAATRHAPAAFALPPISMEPQTMTPRPTPRRGRSWRDQLLAWSDAEDPSPPAFDEQTTLDVVARRLDLQPTAHRLLAVLYANWLHGQGERGLAFARLARAVPDDVDWSEILGRGQLGALRLVETQGGRLRLQDFMARLLDGHPPQVPIVRGGATESGLDLSSTRLVLIEAGETMDRLATRVAQTAEGDLGVIALGWGTDEQWSWRLERGLVETLVFGIAPLIVMTAELAAEADILGLLAGRPAVIAVPPPPPPSLLRLPAWPPG